MSRYGVLVVFAACLLAGCDPFARSKAEALCHGLEEGAPFAATRDALRAEKVGDRFMASDEAVLVMYVEFVFSRYSCSFVNRDGRVAELQVIHAD